MDTLKTISLVVLTLFLAAAGAYHFVNPRLYVTMMPPYFPAKALLNYAAGGAELAVAVLFWVPATRPLAAWLTVALLVSFLPVHLFHLQHGVPRAPHVPGWLLWARLPLQFVLMAWAWWHRT